MDNKEEIARLDGIIRGNVGAYADDLHIAVEDALRRTIANALRIEPAAVALHKGDLSTAVEAVRLAFGNAIADRVQVLRGVSGE